MKIPNIKLHTKAAKQSCDVCGHQLSQQKKSDKQRKIVHEGAMVIHEGVKHPCRICNDKGKSCKTHNGNT